MPQTIFLSVISVLPPFPSGSRPQHLSPQPRLLRWSTGDHLELRQESALELDFEMRASMNILHRNSFLQGCRFLAVSAGISFLPSVKYLLYHFLYFRYFLPILSFTLDSDNVFCTSTRTLRSYIESYLYELFIYSNYHIKHDKVDMMDMWASLAQFTVNVIHLNICTSCHICINLSLSHSAYNVKKFFSPETTVTYSFKNLALVRLKIPFVFCSTYKVR